MVPLEDQWITRTFSIIALGTMNVCTWSHADPSSICRYISMVVDKLTLLSPLLLAWVKTHFQPHIMPHSQWMRHVHMIMGLKMHKTPHKLNLEIWNVLHILWQ